MKTDRASVSVIIPTYNRQSLVTLTIDSILNQSRPADEIIVVDDGSTDDTAEVLSRYGDAINYVFQPNAGKSAALNHGLRKINADYIWIMDDDDIARPNALKMHLDCLASQPECDFTYSGCHQFRGNNIPTENTKLILDNETPPPDAAFLVSCLSTFPFFMQSMLISSAVYRKTGPFDEALKRGQDYDMIIRIAQHFHGAKINAPTFYLRHHAGVRGPSTDLHSEADKKTVWRTYDRLIFSKVRESLALSEYLAGHHEPSSLSLPQKRQALLQRAYVMARHGLFPEALSDLQSATEKHHMTTGFSREEKTIFVKMADIPPTSMTGYRIYFCGVGSIIFHRATMQFCHCFKGLYWGLIRELKHRHFLSATKYIWFGLCLIMGSTLSPGTKQKKPLS